MSLADLARAGVCVTALGVLVLLTGCASSESAAERKRYEEKVKAYDNPSKQWQELDVPLPAYPREQQLAEFRISGATSFSLFADIESVRVDEDGIVRYTLVARSSTGFDNVSFEGIRCDTREFKIYAIGSPDGTWSARQNAQWRRIERKGANDIHHSLYHYYLCPHGGPHLNTGDAVAALKHGEPVFKSR